MSGSLPTPGVLNTGENPFAGGVITLALAVNQDPAALVPMGDAGLAPEPLTEVSALPVGDSWTVEDRINPVGDENSNAMAGEESWFPEEQRDLEAQSLSSARLVSPVRWSRSYFTPSSAGVSSVVPVSALDSTPAPVETSKVAGEEPVTVVYPPEVAVLDEPTLEATTQPQSETPAPTKTAVKRAASGSSTVSATARSASLLASVPTFAPFGLDANTLHLWHLNDTAAPVADAGVTSPLPLQGLLGGATLTGTTSLAGLGGSLLANNGTTTGGLLLAAAALADGAGDSVAFSHANATTGAFTYEAVIKFDSGYNPLTQVATPRNMQIISMEGDGTADRVFQFRYVGRSTSALPRIEFINLGGSVQTLKADIPVTGTNAVSNTDWFHVAVTYDGNANVAGNFKIYWTKLTGAETTASLLGSGNMAVDLQAVAADFALGNEARAIGGQTDGFAGSIDEVRISNIARAATAMMPNNADNDTDGLPDGWETLYFGNLDQTGAGNPDGDGFTNAQEYAASSNPNNAASVPGDTDGDGLPDSWEATYFGALTYGPSDDPDADGFTNAQEYAAGTNPNNSASNPNDADNDGLPDAWEMSNFGVLTYGGTDDPDGDWFTNAQEYAAGTNPYNASSFPAGPRVRFIPVDDGNASTSEYGYAGASNINVTAFICSGLKTVGTQQFMTYYGRHQTDSAYTYNNTLWVARRTVGAKTWQVFRTTFTANDITDGHDVICFGIDGEGYMHISWGMHNGNSSAYHYAKSTGPVTGTGAITFGADLGTMTGNETVVTYPQFLTLPNGDLLYFYRHGDPATGGSGSGDEVLNRYSLATHTWTNVTAAGTQNPFIKGIWPTSYNAYPNMPCVDASGNIYLTWTWRYTPDWQTNEHFAFAKSTDFGVTWQRSTGSTYSLPISEKAESGVENTRAEQVLTIPQQSSLINQAGMCLDDLGQPVIGTWWAPLTSSGNYRRQYMIVYPSAPGVTPWVTRQVSNRTVDLTTYKDTTAAAVRDLGRPVPLVDKQGRVLLVYRDNHSFGGLTVVYCGTRAADPTRSNWTTLDLSSDNLGSYEPVVDVARWEQDNVLSVIYQPTQYTAHNGLTYTPPANTASPIGVLEWDEAAYFKPTVSAVADQTLSKGVASSPIAITVGDIDTAAADLTLSGVAADPTIIPTANIVFSGTGASRTMTITPAQTGTTTITITVSDGTNTATRTFNVLVRTASENWRQLNFGTTANTGTAADTADPNGDGTPNLLEFFLNRNPQGSNASSTLPIPARSGSELTLTYTRSLAAMSELTYAVEWSDTLASGSWSTTGVTTEILTDNGVVQSVKASVTAGSGKRFLRLKVTRP